jgi:hypothetical protein
MTRKSLGRFRFCTITCELGPVSKFESFLELTPTGLLLRHLLERSFGLLA